MYRKDTGLFNLNNWYILIPFVILIVGNLFFVIIVILGNALLH